MTFDKPRTKAMQKFLEQEQGRVVGLSIEPDGVFIYTNSSEWCDDAGSGTFRGDSETAAIRRFRERVRPAAPPAPEAQMDSLDAVMLIESGDATDEQMVEAFQSLIDSGVVWKLQGFYGRTARGLIEAGYCTPAKEN